MAQAHNMASLSISPTLSIQFKHTRTFKLLKVWVINKKLKPTEISTNVWLLSEEKPDLKLDEFVVTSSGEIRTLIEQIRKEVIFTDTGKRVQFNTNLWGEVWRLRPEHLAPLTEKEAYHEQDSNRNSPEL